MKMLFILFLTLSALFADGIKWEKDYATALKQAKILNKPMMFIISSHTCHFCVQLESTALKDSKVIQKINTNYVAAIVYMEENPLFPRELYVGGTPATWFIKEDGEPLFEPLMGAVDATTFSKALDIVSKEYKKTKK
ncbi:MAG: thioredoxin family protein [Sulfuricurvum sp.]|nr:thioredoxin family protein [Sulfuricurvum sp.]MDD5386398.1 thioredoxin family protein [Sulfuricurvum sp.]